MAVRKKTWRTLAKEWFTALAIGTPAFQEKAPEQHDPAPLEHKINKDILPGGTQTASKDMFRVAPHHRIIAGMGSGGPEDVNTYALAGDRKYNMRDHTRLLRGGQPVTSDQDEEAAKTAALGGGIADVFDKQYDWSNGKPVPKPQEREPVWVIDHIEDIVLQHGRPLKDGFYILPRIDSDAAPPEAKWIAVRKIVEIVPLPQKHVPVWVVDHVEDIVVGDDGAPRKSGFVVTRCHDGGCEWSAVKVTE